MRSVLFTPGTRPDRVSKAWATGAADVVVADLEDAVALAEKASARHALADVLAEATGPCIRAVRINPFPTDLALADLEAILPARPDMIVVPKAEQAELIERLRQRIPSDIGLLLIIESAAGVLHAESLAAVEGVTAVAFGAEDLAADAGMVRSEGNSEIAMARSWVALAAAAAGIPAIDMITPDIRDMTRFRREADEAVGLGYAGKMCLHPSQVAEAHAAWAPTDAQIAWAQEVMDAVGVAGAEAGGVVEVGGKMIDVPLIRQAQAILSRTERAT